MALSPGGLKTLQVLSQKAYGRVYLAQDADGARYALKELLFGLVPTAQELDAFEREGAMLAALEHPQIPRFIRSFREGSGAQTRLYLAQRFVDGQTLQARLAEGPVAEEEAWSVAEQVLGVLAFLHERPSPVIHRDVKPANLVLGAGGQVTLVDFGAARALAREQTHGATLVGTFGYMPPEQLGGTVDARADLYGLGATLVHALTGRPPSELMADGLLLDFEPHVRCSRPMRALLRKLLAPRREDRARSAREALALANRRHAGARQRSPLRPRTLAALAAGLSVLFAVGATVAWLVAAPTPPPEPLPVIENPTPVVRVPLQQDPGRPVVPPRRHDHFHSPWPAEPQAPAR